MLKWSKKKKKYLKKIVIRFKRRGKLKNFNYDIIVVNLGKKQSTSDYIEKLGHYDPRKTEKIFFIKVHRLAYWINKGAYIHKTVKKYLVKFLV